jgi:hypothetical protein
MNQSDRRKIDTAADDSIAKMRAARLATKEAANAITRRAPDTELQPFSACAVIYHIKFGAEVLPSRRISPYDQ